MRTTPDDLVDLPAVTCGLLDWQRVVRSMRPLAVTVDESSPAGGLRTGSTTWATDVAGDKVCMSWTWGEVMSNVVAMCDPMRVRSNAVIMDECGREVSAERRILLLNGAIFRLQWQDAVLVPDRRGHVPLAA